MCKTSLLYIVDTIAVMFVGPIVGALVNRYGCRPVTIAGSLLGAAAFIISTFAPSIFVFQLTYGVIGGTETAV